MKGLGDKQTIALICSFFLFMGLTIADTETTSATVSVSNVAPVIDDASVRIDGAVPPTAVDPLENTVSPVNITWNASDNNGYADIVSETCFVSRGNVLYLRFEENTSTSAHDISKEENDGTITGATWTGSGKYGNALDFHGDNYKVSIPYSSNLNFSDATTNGSFTVMAWIYPFSAYAGGIVERWNDFGLRFGTDRKMDAYVDTTDGTAAAGQLSNVGLLDLNTWSHVVFSWDGSTIKVYIDGTLSGTKSWGGVMETATADIQVGKTGSYNSFNGTIDEVMIFNRALSAKEIEDIYNKGYLNDSATSYSCSGTQCTYECFIDMQYYDTPGTWDVSIDVIDSGGLHDTNYTTFTYNQLNAIATYNEPITYGSGYPTDLLFDSDGIQTKNTGNIDLNISFKGEDLVGQTDSSYNISVSKVEWDVLNGTVLWMPFEEGSGSTTEDKSAQDNDGTVYATWTTGKFGNALDFDGDWDNVTIPDHSSLNITGDITLAAWIYPRAFSNHIVIAKGYGGVSVGTAVYYIFTNTTGKPRFSIGNGTTEEALDMDYALSTDTWYHLVGVWNSSANMQYIYLNGVLNKSRATTISAIQTRAVPLMIGQNAHATYPYEFNGTIDEVFVLNRALSASEVSDLYSKGFPNPTTLSYSSATIKTDLAPRYNTTSWTRIEIPTGIKSQDYSGTFTYES